MGVREARLNNLLEDIRGKRGSGLKGELRRQMARGLDPNVIGAGDYGHYADDPVGFAREALGVETLTAAQEEMLLAVRDHRIVVITSATAVGKTWALAVIGLWWYLCRKGVKVYTFAAPPEDNLRDLLWGEVFAHTQSHPEMFVDHKVRSSLRISKGPKDFMTGILIPSSSKPEEIETKFSGKHAPHLLFLGDEVDAVPDPVFKGVDGCMSSEGAKMVLCLNPKKRVGYVWELINTGRAHVIVMNAMDHPNVITGENEIPGAVARENTVQRINEWTEELPPHEQPDDETWELPEFLVGDIAHNDRGLPYPPLRAGYRKIIDGQFSTKVLGRYPPSGSDMLIQPKYIDEAQAKWERWVQAYEGTFVPPSGVRPDMTVDVAGGGPDHNVAVFKWGDIIGLPIKWGAPGLDSVKSADRAAELYMEFGAKIVYVDNSGVGNGVAGRMVTISVEQDYPERINAVPVMLGEKSSHYNPEGSFLHIRDEAYFLLAKAFKDGRIMIPPANVNASCQKLDRSLRALTYEIIGKNIRVVSKKILISRLDGVSPDEMDALMLHYTPSRTWMGKV